MRILVTGGAGFIGVATVYDLATHGHHVTTYDIATTPDEDITIPANLHAFIQQEQPDVIVHLAGLLGTSELLDDVPRAERVNVGGTINLLEECKRARIPLVFMSKPNPEDWHNIYTITKMACEDYCRVYAKEFGLDITILRPYNAYGPGQKTYPKKFCPTFIMDALAGKFISVYGSGEQVIDPVYVDDIARAIRLVIEKRAWGKTIEIGIGKPVTVNAFAEMIRTKVGEFVDTAPGITHVPMRIGEPEKTVSRIWADTTNMMSILGMCPGSMIQLAEGIERTVRWYARTYQS